MTHLTIRLSLAAALALAFGAPAAQASDAAPAHALSFNASLTSDYRYRGLSQTRRQPAIQGGADYTHSPTGFYAGAWASSIKWIKDLGGDAGAEIDMYAGKRGEWTSGGASYDVGVLYYAYPSNELNPDADTVEVYGQVGFGPAYVKYSHSTSNLFGTADSKGSGYLDLGANVELMPGLVLNLHAGRQMVANNGAYSYNDFKIGVTKDLGYASLAVAVIGADTHAYVSPVNGKNLAAASAVISISKTF